MPKKDIPSSTSDKLDEIIKHLRALDRRDRNRTWGSFLKIVIYFALFFGSIWYAYKHGDQFLEKIAQQAARQAAIITEEQSGKVLKQFENIIGR